MRVTATDYFEARMCAQATRKDSCQNLLLTTHTMKGLQVRIRASLFPALTAVIMMLTSCVSVMLSLLWQEQHESRSIPYISDAHYDLEQSPVFTALVTSTGMLFILSIISVHIALCKRKIGACVDPQRCSPESAFKTFSTMSLVFGSVAAICLILTGSLYSDFWSHAVAAITSGTALVLWMVSVIVMLAMIPDTSTLSEKIGYRLMISCALCYSGSVIAFVVLRARNGNESGVVMEYVAVGVANLFLILVCGQLRSCKLLVVADEAEDTSPL